VADEEGDASKVTLRAAVAGLDGRVDESLALYADALGLWATAGLPFDRALTAIDMLVVLGPDKPAARAAGEEARELFTQLRARPLLEILDRAMSGPWSPAPELPPPAATEEPIDLDGAASGVDHRIPADRA